MKGEKVTPKEASRVLGISPEAIRKGLRDGTLPIGHARKTGEYRRLAGPGRFERTARYAYDIYKPKVLEYTGLKEWPEGGKG